MSQAPCRYRRAASVLSRTVGDEILLAALDAGDFKALSGTARFIWVLLEEPRSAAELALVAQERFGVSQDVVIGDIELLLTELIESGLAERLM